jgi:hypothetical protein
MQFYGFDLDHTLGDFSYLDKYLDFFKFEDPIKTSDSLKTKLDNGYKVFIKNVVAGIHRNNSVNSVNKTNKNSYIPTGICKIFNPELLEFFVENKAKFESGEFKAIIYSNNTYYETLRFAKDVIEEYVGCEIFCYLMHWDHKFRNDEIVKGDPGNARKTWAILKKGFETGCGGEPEPANVKFYDDLIHEELVKTLDDNYVHLTAYYAVPSTDLLMESVLIACEESGLDEDAEYHKILTEYWDTPIPIGGLSDILDILGEYVEYNVKQKGGFKKTKKRSRSKPRRKRRTNKKNRIN